MPCRSWDRVLDTVREPFTRPQTLFHLFVYLSYLSFFSQELGFEAHLQAAPSLFDLTKERKVGRFDEFRRTSRG